MRDMNSRSTTPTPTLSSTSPMGMFGDHMRIAACCNQGGRKHMEDRINIHCEFTENGQVDYVYVGIYDGHGGADASNFTNQHLLQNIVKQPGFNSLQDSEVLEAIRAGFLETHNAMRKVVDGWPRTASGFTSTAGTTASVAFIRRGKLYIGHVGDSGIVLGSQRPTGEFVGVPLTVEHKPDTPEEKKRIEEIGGEVMSKSGVMRVVWVRPLRGHQGPVRRSTPKEKIPFLAVARALGDLWSYNSDMDAFVVSPEPDVSVMQLDSTHRCLIFGSDGLWNVLRPQHAVDIVNSHEWKEDEMSWIANQNEGYETNHARWLGRHGLMRWGNLRADNISVVTIVFGNRGVVDSSYAKRVEPDGLSIEDILTTEPTSIIKVAPNRVTAVPTKPVELVFYGVCEANDRHHLFNGNHSSAAHDYHRIPGYTNHERGPMFGPLLSSGPSSSYSPMGRSSLHGSTPYRQYSQPSNVFSTIGSPKSIVGKENGASSGSLLSTVSITSKMTTTTRVHAAAVGNMEEESEVEDERLHSTTTCVSLETKMETTVKSEGNVDDNQENGRESNFVKCSSTPCKAHGVASCCNCTLIRAPLALWSVGGDSTTRSHEREEEFHITTPSMEVSSGAASALSARRHTANSASPAINLLDAYKCRRLVKQRRSCPNPGTPHSYNTRQSCRTTRAGTKLSPQKSLATKLSTATPSMESYHRQSRLVASSSRRRSTVPQSEQPSVRSRRRRSSIIRHQIDPESTPIRHASSTAKAMKARKALKIKDGMRLRSSKTPTIDSRKDMFTSFSEWKKLANEGCSLNQDRVGTKEKHVDANMETLGEQFLESLNLETPNVTNMKRNRDGGESGRFQRQIQKGPLSLDEIMADGQEYVHLRSSGSSKSKNYKSMTSKKAQKEEDRRRSSMLVSLKRKLYFDDHALIEHRSTATTSSTLSKRIKNFNMFMKRSTT